VTGKLRHHYLEVVFELTRDGARPRSACLSEPVNEHDRRSPALPRRVELERAGRQAPLGSRRTSRVTVAASFSATLVDEWVRAGLTDAVVAPGSRSTPLVVALARESRIALHVMLDERSAAFFAVGIGLANRPAGGACHDERDRGGRGSRGRGGGHLSRVPLIVCTADRPPELHHVGAPQTIEQAGLFAGALRWAVDPGVPDEQARSSWRLAR